MKYIIGAVLISSLVFFLIALFANATGLIPSKNLLQYGWIVWGVLTALCYPLAKKIMIQFCRVRLTDPNPTYTRQLNGNDNKSILSVLKCYFHR